MTVETHAVSPEELMALVDGELLLSDARRVAEHVDRCPECTARVEEFRGLSGALDGWRVEDAPDELDGWGIETAANAPNGKKPRSRSVFYRASFWGWKQWTPRIAGSAAVLLVVSISILVFPGQRKQAAYYLAPNEASRHETLSNVAPEMNAQTFYGYSSSGALKSSRGKNGLTVVNPAPVARAIRGGGGDGRANIADTSVVSPMIARSVSLTIVVKDFALARASIDGILARYNGYSAELVLSTPEHSARSFEASLRIPAPQLSDAVHDLEALGHVEYEKESGEEVTQQHADLAARLKNSRETEERLRAILEQRTGKIEDVLQVEEEIARVRGEIEEMETEQKALEHRVDFASIELHVTEEYKERLSAPDGPVSTQMGNALVKGYRHLAEAALGLTLWTAEYGPVLLVVLAIFAGPGFFLWRRYRRMTKAQE